MLTTLHRRVGNVLLGVFASLSVLLAAQQTAAQEAASVDFQNTVSQQSSTAWPPAPVVNLGPNAPTSGQHQNATAYGGWRSSAQLPTTPTNPLSVPTGNGIRLEASALGKPIAQRGVSIFFGAPIPPPSLTVTGQPVNGATYYHAQPSSLIDAYFSAASQTVYASQPGRAIVTWSVRNPEAGQPTTLTTSYIVSPNPDPNSPSRQLLWTENGYRGPLINIPDDTEVKIVFNRQVPATVPSEFPSPYRQKVAGSPPLLTTVWRENALLRAYNAEGWVLLELTTSDGRFIGVEKVKVIREIQPTTVLSHVGDALRSFPARVDLVPSIVSGRFGRVNFVEEHVSPSGELLVYGIRTTSHLDDAQGNPRPTGEVALFWSEEGFQEILWPRFFNSYVLRWPSTSIAGAYSHYLRAPATEGDPDQTAVALVPSNNSSLIFQSDPTGLQSRVIDGNRFYTLLSSTDRDGFALLKHTNGEHVWYERVHSFIASDQPSYATTLSAIVGQRIDPPSGRGLEANVGYIRLHPSSQAERRYRSAYDAQSYIDPFKQGFDAARAGAIIPVNASTGITPTTSPADYYKLTDHLEVWWYKRSTPPAGTTGLVGNYWPAVVHVYKPEWPTDATPIVLASNKGSGTLPAGQRSGSIYYQNDVAKPGFNPNDEHALILSGTVWALRDDLGTSTTSRPFVLLRYTHSDSRPAMRVFSILREDYDAVPPVIFNYSVEAGKILQPPMPMPLLGPAFFVDSKGIRTATSFEESQTKAPAPANKTASKPDHYDKFTFTDRNGSIWIYRGPHTPSDEANSFQMKYYYPSQAGFYVPGKSFDDQPKPGSPMPYLRNALKTDATAAEIEAYATRADNQGVSQQPVGITYRPIWPVFAPVLRMGETLTSPRYGLPAIRGQSSVRILYEQDLANDPLGSNVTLFDPTVAKKSSIADADLAILPTDITTNLYQGRYYFPTLPPHLVERVYFDTNIGSKGSLVFLGKFIDEALGDDYLQLNVLTIADIKALKGLCTGADKTKWEQVIDNLSVNVTRYVRDTKTGAFAAAEPDGDLATRITKVWDYIKAKDWATVFTPPTAADISTGSTIPNTNKQLDTARDWIATKLNELQSAYRSKQNPQTSPERLTLESNFASAMKTGVVVETGSWSRFGSTYIHRIPSFTGTSSVGATLASEQLQAAAIKEWLFAQAAPDPATNAAPTTRAWDSAAGKALTINDLLAANLQSKVWISDGRPLDEDAIYLREGSLTAIPRTFLEKAWKFVEANRNNLEEWSAKASAPSPSAEAYASLEADYRAAEINAASAVDGSSVVELTHEDQAADSYALTGDGGEGYVTVMVGQGSAFTPAAEPVSMYILRVAKPLASGEIKVIQPTNPLSEKLTLQSSLDFAGKPEAYEFQWRTLPPTDGLPPAVYTFARNPIMLDGVWTLTAADDTTSNVNLPATIRVVANEPSQPAVSPIVKATRSFSLATRPHRLFLSFSKDATDGVSVTINGTVVANLNYPDSTNSVPTTPPVSGFAPLTHFFEVPTGILNVGAGPAGDNTIQMNLSSTAALGTSTVVNCRLEGLISVDHSDTWNFVSASADEGPDATNTPAIKAKARHVIEGTSILTLTDNYFIYRYRAINANHAAYAALPDGGWSNWSEPQLAEGWIKRALAGINPFEQRIKDLYNNAVNSDVSLVTQAGKRWEGDIPLNLAKINDYGLIEIYETILRRGKGLSIEGAPAINYGPANDALLLAAGYLNDLYMILGNEAYADAQNPTIAYGTNSGVLGDTASAQFAFRGQLASVLDEELTLLRGRDDFLAPGTKVTPVFNRLIWNYTRGIAAGEVVYALNYNIKDLNADGTVNAADAAKAYPQGHGDAYGHYLMALKNYYSLLWNPNFDWVPRIEAVLVLGKPVSVDYLDERKFAGAAVAWTRTTAQTVDLTYRQSYNPAAKGREAVNDDPTTAVSPTWAHLSNERGNIGTGIKRTWGVDDWATRGGQGAFFHWASASAMLPETDPDESHEGIQKIDRTTVAEIGEIASQAQTIQRLLDNADQHLNPLGLSDGAVPFDVAVNTATEEAGQPHYEQIYDRALGALSNASVAFDRAKGATALLRDQDETLDDQRDTINTQERAFEAQLIDLYGTPYTDDIGPGKAYPQGYTGPDLLHYGYVDLPELFKNSGEDDESEQTFRLAGDTDFAKAISNIELWGKYSSPSRTEDGDREDIGILKLEPTDELIPAGNNGIGEYITYTLDGNGRLRKPSAWTGRRAHPGGIQQALSAQMLARLELTNALEDYQDFTLNFRRAARNFQAVIKAHYDERSRMVEWNKANQSITNIIAAIDLGLEIRDEWQMVNDKGAEALADGLPKVVGTANDTTSALRAAFRTMNGLQTGAKATINTIALAVKAALSSALAGVESDHEFQAFDIGWKAEHLQLISDLKGTWEELEDGTRAVDIAVRNHHEASENVRTLIAQGDTIQREREFFRRRAAAIIHGYRTKDLGFRIFRDEALESYRSLFDLASRYTYLASRAYDYETALLDPVRSTTAKAFLQDIVKARAVGVFTNGVPQASSTTIGDPGLAGVLARMNADWSVAKHRLGLNNPARNQTIFSLRREMKRVSTEQDGDVPWRDYLATCRRANLLADQDVKRHCLNINPRNLLTVPGYVIEFSTTIEEGVNFFGNPLMGGDQTFSPSAFTTKIRYSGIGLKGYIGMASPTSIGGSIESPNDPGTGFTDPNALSATPYVYLVPSGLDSMRAPSNTDTNIVRSWMIEDQAVPLPFDIGGAFSSANALSGFSTLREQFTLRKHGAFRAVPGDTVFSSATNFTSTRLISRSVWNSKWKLVIPGSTLLAEPINGMAKFLQQVKDIQLYFDTYSAAGN